MRIQEGEELIPSHSALASMRGSRLSRMILGLSANFLGRRPPRLHLRSVPTAPVGQLREFRAVPLEPSYAR